MPSGFSFANLHTNRTIPVGSIAIEQVRPSEVTTAVVIIIVFLSLAWTTVALRIWTRAVVVRCFGWDDGTIIISMVLFTVFCAAIMVCAYVTMGDSFLRISDLSPALNWLMTAEVFYVLTMLVLKISLGLFLLRIMVKRWQQQVVYVAMTTSTLMSTGYFFFACFQCGYTHGDAWTFFLRKLSNQCVTPEQIIVVSYTHAGITAATDLLFTALPLFMLRGSKVMGRERVIVSLILVLGGAGGIASCIRFKYIPKLATGGLQFFAEAQLLAIWSIVEPGLGIMAGCIATLRPLFRTFLRRAMSNAQHEEYVTDETVSLGTIEPNRSHINIEEDAMLFANPTYLKGSNIDAGHCTPKEPWRPGGKYVRTPTPTPTNGFYEAIEMRARPVEHATNVEEAANVYDTSRMASNRPTAPHAACTRQYYK
ncbi:hypothetical protein E2P81_ATG03991 [Venturia nashicola]|nr:hypothetical protein E2P81_ATG03991 [Venturia nashicola]